MSIAPPQDVQRFWLLIVAVATWVLSVPVFIFATVLFLAVPSATFGLVIGAWLSALIYGALLIYRAWREKTPSPQATRRLIAAAALSGAGCLVGFLLLWAVMAFGAATQGGSLA
jgi:hypothetical protein